MNSQVPQDVIAIRATPLEVGPTIDAAGGGAVAVFLGMTRGERNAAGLELAALEYEAYWEMAERQMRKLATEARARWGILRVVMLHRTGRVAVGEASVLIAVSTPHRGEAFEACRFLIDRVKAEAAIWKKEIWRDGSGSWVAGVESGKSE